MGETYRYYWIFKDEKLCKVIEDNINMKYKDFVICAFGYIQNLLNSLHLDLII